MSEIYIFNLDGADAWTLERFSPYISQEKLERIQRYRFLQDKLRSLFGEILIKYLIGTRFGLRPGEIRIAAGEQGKPYLPDFEGLFFNISHAKKWVVCSMGANEQGIDVEYMSEDLPSIEKRIFTPLERREYSTLDEAQRRHYLYRAWTLKESFSKYRGVGLEIPFSDIEFVGDGSNMRITYQGTTAEARHIIIDNDYSLSLCEEHIGEYSIKEISQNQFLSFFSRQ